jgi:hypothetical protein
MHSVGLYNGRYGFSQFVVRTQTTTSLSVPEMCGPLVNAVQEHELARQARLKSTLIQSGGRLFQFSLRSRCTAMLAGLRTLTHAGCGPDR